MIAFGMPVFSRDGERIGCVASVIEDESGLPPGLVITVARRFGLRQRRLMLTTFDVRDVRNGKVFLRITRWDTRNRASQLVHRRRFAGPVHRPPFV